MTSTVVRTGKPSEPDRDICRPHTANVAGRLDHSATSNGKTGGSQHMERSQRPQPHVLLLDLDTRRRNQFASVLRGRGFKISVMSYVAEIERWPSGQIVVVDAARFTPWWIEVGAVRVVVLSATAVQESRVYNGVPCMWIPDGAGPDALIAAL